MVITMCLAMLAIGFIDRKYQNYEFEKSIKMTKQEIKDEYKNIEGDPIIKAKIRSAQMQFMKQKMMSAVPQADVVVANPTHYSVAIKYDKSKAPAPVVVAKGVDFMAFKIREIAKANNVPIVVNKPLARALYKLVKVDSVIPAELYVAVAEILAFIYKKENTNIHSSIRL
jgi:flagellar biosynthetic protein FlhB